MKRFDDSTKKLIKNIAALITSALVLVAATIAWLSTGSSSTVDAVHAGISGGQFSIDYYHPEKGDYILAGATCDSGASSSAAFAFWSDSDGTAASFPLLPAHEDDPSTESVNEDKWGAPSSGVGDIDWSIDSLIPGDYDSFIVDVKSSTTSNGSFVIKGLRVTNPSGGALMADQVETVLKNVYVYALVYTKTVTTDDTTGETTTAYSANPTAKVCDSLFNLKSGDVVTVLNGVDAPSTIVFYIGVPGESVTTVTSGDTPTSETDHLQGAHDALRQIGAKIHFDSITVQ